MIKRNKIMQVALTMAAISGFSGIAYADRSEAIHYADELEACVTALREKIDLKGVHRIRHIVTKSDANGIGYALTLKTSTYAGDTEKQYSAYCVAIGNNRPSRLRIDEKTS